jgi:hypothetical protein
MPSATTKMPRFIANKAGVPQAEKEGPIFRPQQQQTITKELADKEINTTRTP